MATISYKTNQIKLNVPSKVLSTSVSAVEGHEYWDYANDDTDPWYSGSVSKKYHRWRVTMNVTAQPHGSNLTRDDFVYNGLDIVVGDWIAGATTGLCVKIISVLSKTPTSVTCIVEDYLRYNTFRQTNGNGIFGPGAAVVFNLNENGQPILDPLPDTVVSNFYSIVMGRFNYLNPALNYVLEQPDHGFAAGDVVSVTSEGFVKANTLTMDRMIGVVTDPGPGPNYFIISPNNRIIDFDPSIPGEQGDYVYVSDTGELTTESSKKIVFLKVQNAIPTVLRGSIDDPELPVPHTVTFNNVPVVFSGAANLNVSQIVGFINTETANHKVVAESVLAPTQAQSNIANTAYGLVGGYPPFSAYFDTGSGNTLITFTSTGSEFSGVSGAQDIRADIVSAGIANLEVAVSGGVLALTELNGNNISIYNNTPDANGYPFAGTVSVSGLPVSASTSGANRLKLTRSDGGEILIYESTEFFRINTGVASGHTGMYPLAMNIEQGLRSGGLSVVPTIAARDSLSPIIGDMAYVLNKGNGEWGLFLYNNISWVEVSNQDSATTDAKTLTTTFTMPVSGGSATTNILGNISPGRKIVTVSIEVDDVFVGASQTPNIQVGTTATPDQFVVAASNDLTESITFEQHPDYVHPVTETQDLQIRATCNHYAATAGQVTVKLTYV
jgi:hypothetical protein